MKTNKYAIMEVMMQNSNKKVMLVILDGWGIAGPTAQGNAIYKANTPTINTLEKNYLAMPLQASGIGVGLPWGQEGNSEVGHMNLGAGRIVYQYLPRIVGAIRDKTFFKNKAFLGASDFVKRNNSTLHIMGLLSTGTVHSYIDHLYALLDFAKAQDISRVVLHVFTDGKDGGPKEGGNFVQHLQERLQKIGVGKIGTIMGRAYAMDRNSHWELTEKAYNLMTAGQGNIIQDPHSYIEECYSKNQTDLDIEPAVVHEGDSPVGLIKEGDAVIFYNFREDSARQITRAFVLPEKDFTYFPRKKISNLYFVGMTQYQDDLPIEVAFPPPKIENSLAKVLADSGKKQLHIAETEKYAHISYFFNGENEEPNEGEERILVPSIGTPHYEKVPEMQAYNITQKVLENINSYDFFLINFANADMLGHSGSIEATIKGVEAIDANLSTLFEACKNLNIALVITADHGNAEEMMDKKTGQVVTRHSTNPVPLIIVDSGLERLNPGHLYEQSPKGVLADVAPTILKIMGLDIPPEMTGQPLV
ncbi:MAG: 2,3-bisphosphoglycerate-independent phosphoglycerate mutase [Candidatus Spechtbacterales bacterium]